MMARGFDKLANPQGPGIQYVVVNKNSVIVEKSIGLANVAKGISLGQEHTMAAFSMTKTLTAIAVLQLVERNQIGVDDKASKYIKHPYHPDISIRQLLSHTAGIPNPIPLRWVHLAETHGAFDEEKALNQILLENRKSESRPGTKYRYSNIGYWLLGRIIEEVGLRSYARYVRENIFEPLGLGPREIGFLIVDEESHAKGYLKKWSFMNVVGRFFIDTTLLGDDEGGWIRLRDVYVNGPSFGGAIGTAAAFSKILQDLLSDQSKLLQNTTKKLLYSQQQTNEGNRIEMTLGWHRGYLEDFPYYYKEGGGAGFHCEMHIYPENGIASVLMTNRTSFHTRRVLVELDSQVMKKCASIRSH